MKPLVAMVFGIGVLAAHPAWAQMESREGIALQNQILELRRDVQTLRNSQGSAPAPTYGGSSLGNGRPAQQGGGSGEITSQLLERVDRLEETVRALQGRIDEVDNARTRQGADLAKQISDLQFKIDNGAAAAPGPAPRAPALLSASPAPRAPASPTTSQAPTPLGTLPATAAVKRTPELALQEGNAALARRDYAAAEADAREVLAGGKAAPRGYDAQFLLAQAMMGGRNYPQAAVAYDDTYNRAKTGSHAQDSLVGLANSLVAINEKRSACAALDTLRAQFPAPRHDIGAKATALRATAGCK